jgi:signal transduction histidine kinase/DNA-binding response OmpR family regulator
MHQSTANFEADLRLSVKGVLIVLALCGQTLFLIGDFLYISADDQFRVSLLATLLYLLALVVWLLGRWQAGVGGWLLVAGLAALIYVGHGWLNLPGFLALLMIPTSLAALLISLPAALAVALGASAGLLLSTSAAGQMTTAVPPLMVIWATLGVMWAVYRPVRRVAYWSWDYFQQARLLIEETQNRKVELEQTMHDLARANLQLTRLNIMAQGLRHAAEEARRAKEEFVANVSHELRTPLNMITGFSETILQAPESYGDQIPAALLADLAVIHRNATHLSDLINDVLDLSQIDAQQMALTKEQVQIQEIVKAAAIAVRPLFDSKGLYLEIEAPPDLPPIFCDRTRIREVLLNLLSNAGRFTKRGGVKVRICQDEHDLIVAVADTGAGIATEDMSKLFQPFQQVDASIRRRYGGTGLGLSISKRFIELHGGRIWVESEPGAGTTFFFRLPVILPMMPVGGELMRSFIPDWEYLQPNYPSKAPKARPQPRLVLLETGGDALHRLLRRYLDDIEIVAVSSLEQALQELSTTPCQAFIANDLSVAGALQRLQAAELPVGVPAMICSVPEVYEATDTLGASAYLVKPVSQETLLAALDRLGRPIKTVLIVDDEPDMLRLFRRMLAAAGRNYRVLRANNGQAALQLLRQHRPNVILLDLVMPRMDGFQLLKAKSQEPALKDIPVIVISARDPTGQPIVSNAFAITQAGGLSAHHLLSFIKGMGQILATDGSPADPTPPKTPAG